MSVSERYLVCFSSDRLFTLAYDLGWHQLVDSQHKASPPVQEQLGHRLKSSLHYQLLYDPREARQLSTGWAFRWSSLLHGLFPHTAVSKALKNRMDLQLSWKFLPWSSLSVGAAAGVLFPLSRDFRNARSCITDRFYLGGVDSLKGFHPNRIGPSVLCRSTNSKAAHLTSRDYLGGDVMASAYASVSFLIAGCV